MTRPFYVDPDAFEREWLEHTKNVRALARAAAPTERDQLLIDMQERLHEPLLAALKTMVHWHNEERSPALRAQALGSFVAIVIKNFAMNCPDSADALFAWIERGLEMEDGDDGDAVSMSGSVAGQRGGNT